MAGFVAGIRGLVGGRPIALFSGIDLSIPAGIGLRTLVAGKRRRVIGRCLVTIILVFSVAVLTAGRICGGRFALLAPIRLDNPVAAPRLLGRRALGGRCECTITLRARISNTLAARIAGVDFASVISVTGGPWSGRPRLPAIIDTLLSQTLVAGGSR